MKAPPQIEVRSSNDTTKRATTFLIHGPAGHGKTTLAASASKIYKDGGPLKDQLWIMTDVGGLDTLADQGIECPHVLDIPLIMRESGMSLPHALNGIQRVLRPTLNENPDITQIVVDTVTSLDDMIVKHYDENCPVTRGNNRDTMGMWTQIRATHKKFFEMITGHGKHVIFLCHQQVVDAEAAQSLSKVGGARIKASSLPGSPEIVPSITGKAQNMYINMCSIVGALMAKQGMGKKLEREVFFGGQQKMAGKSRFPNSLKELEAPDMLAILTKCNLKNI